MRSQGFAILTGLVSVAWADGSFCDAERETMDALLAAFDVTPNEALQLRQYAQTPRTLDDIPVDELAHEDRRVLLQHATLLVLVDGEIHEKERRLLDDLCLRLRIGTQEAAMITSVAARQANDLSKLL